MSLTDNLVAYWHLDEPSAGTGSVTRVDQVSGYALADNNKTASAPWWGTPAAVNFIASSGQFLSTNSDSALQAGDVDFTLMCEVELKSKPGGQNSDLVSKDNTSPAGSREYLLTYRTSTDLFTFFLWRPTDSQVLVAASGLGSPSLNRRYQLFAWHDSSADRAYIQANNGTVNSVATGGALQAASGAAFRVGRSASNTVNNPDAYVRRVAKWNRVLTDGERTQLWNEGVGLPHPFTMAAPSSVGDALVTDALPGGGENAMPYRHRAVSSVTLAGTTYQAYCYWNSSNKLVVGKRALGGAWTFYAMDGTGGRPNVTVSATDNHDVCCLGLDPNGFVHLSYNMHVNALNYAKSTAAIDTWAGGLSTGLSMRGANESSVTYPTFVNDPAGALYFFFRDGTSGNGDLFGYKYDHAATTWAGLAGTTAGKIINGKTSSPVQNPYWNVPAFDSDFGSGGFLHLVWNWRASTDATTAHDQSYVKWDGASWKKADGSAQTVPVTLANCEIIDPVAVSGGLFDLASVDSDSGGHPHVAYRKNDGSGHTNVHHLWHDGAAWQGPVKVTANANLRDTFGLAFPSCQVPALVVRRSDDRAFVFFAGYAAGYGLYYRTSADYTTWTEAQVVTVDVGPWAPTYDRQRYLQDGTLDLPITFFLDNGTGGLTTRLLNVALPDNAVLTAALSVGGGGVVTAPARLLADGALSGTGPARAGVAARLTSAAALAVADTGRGSLNGRLLTPGALAASSDSSLALRPLRARYVAATLDAAGRGDLAARLLGAAALSLADQAELLAAANLLASGRAGPAGTGLADLAALLVPNFDVYPSPLFGLLLERRLDLSLAVGKGELS